jgi:hypothetical protein
LGRHSSLRVCHLPAFLSAFAAGFGAGFAMNHVIGMFLTLDGTGIARVGAKLHKLPHELRSTGFEPPAERTDVCAVAAEFNAGCHVKAFAVGIGQLEAGSGAALTGFGTFEAGICVIVLHHFHINQ